MFGWQAAVAQEFWSALCPLWQVLHSSSPRWLLWGLVLKLLTRASAAYDLWQSRQFPSVTGFFTALQLTQDWSCVTSCFLAGSWQLAHVMPRTRWRLAMDDVVNLKATNSEHGIAISTTAVSPAAGRPPRPAIAYFGGRVNWRPASCQPLGPLIQTSRAVRSATLSAPLALIWNASFAVTSATWPYTRTAASLTSMAL